MRIALINTYSHNGGAAVACLRLAEALSAQNHEVRMVVASQNQPHDLVTPYAHNFVKKLHYLSAFAAERLHFLPYEASKSVRFAYSPASFGVNILDMPEIKNAELLHFHWVNHGFLSLNFFKKLQKLNKPVVFTLHDQWLFTGGCHYSDACQNYVNGCGNCFFIKKPHKNDISHKIWAQKNEILQELNPQIVTCSHWLAQKARESSIFRHTPVNAIANGIDTQVFSPASQADARAKLNLPQNTPLILFAAGNVADPRKGFSYLTQALTMLDSTLPKPELLIFGKSDPKTMENLPLKAHHLGKLHTQSHIAAAYNAANVYVSPSLQDNLPNTIMEALACGLPVTAFDTGGIPEMVQHQHSGFVAPQKDVAALAQGIGFCLQNGAMLGENARNFALSHYDYAHIAKKYLQIYHTALCSV